VKSKISIEYLMTLCAIHPNNYDLGEAVRKKFSYETNREVYNNSEDRGTSED